MKDQGQSGVQDLIEFLEAIRDYARPELYENQSIQADGERRKLNLSIYMAMSAIISLVDSSFVSPLGLALAFVLRKHNIGNKLVSEAIPGCPKVSYITKAIHDMVAGAMAVQSVSTHNTDVIVQYDNTGKYTIHSSRAGGDMKYTFPVITTAMIFHLLKSVDGEPAPLLQKDYTLCKVNWKTFDQCYSDDMDAEERDAVLSFFHVSSNTKTIQVGDDCYEFSSEMSYMDEEQSSFLGAMMDRVSSKITKDGHDILIQEAREEMEIQQRQQQQAPTKICVHCGHPNEIAHRICRSCLLGITKAIQQRALKAKFTVFPKSQKQKHFQCDRKLLLFEVDHKGKVSTIKLEEVMFVSLFIVSAANNDCVINIH
jgi:hypothetical protein